jgi:spermidine/putrescine transport system substrate-binding protein
MCLDTKVHVELVGMSERTPIDRRRYLRAVGTGALTAGLAGCVGSAGENVEETSTRSPRQSRGNEELRGQLGVEQSSYDLEDELSVYQWVNYWPRRVVRNFERAYGVSVTVDTYPSNETLKLTLETEGPDAYDVVFPSDYMVNTLADEALIQPLDVAKLPNWDNLSDRWVERAPYDPGDRRHSAPFQWGTTGIGWHEALVDGPLTSWDAMWDAEYAGQITWLNDMRETLGASLKRLGYSLNTRDQDEIQEAAEALVQHADLVKAFDSATLEDFLINRKASPIHTWSGEAFIGYWELYENGSSPIDYRIPEEGGTVWVDTAAITSDAPHPNAAHAFLNYLLAAKPNAAVANYVRYATPVEAAKEYVDEDLLENPSIYPPEAVRDELEFIRDVGDATELYRKAWKRVTSA